jgi:hypothetical protein
MSWFNSMLNAIGISTLPPVPGERYFYWLVEFPYKKDVLDCSNKAAAYTGFLKGLGYEAEYVIVQPRRRGSDPHAVVWYKEAGVEYYADPTTGARGWWGDGDWTVTRFRDISFGGKGLETDGIAWDDWRATQ